MTEKLPTYMSYADWHPGEFIRDEMEHLGFTQVQIAARLDTTPKKVSHLLSHKVRITEEYATRLERVLGLPASFWLSLESKWQASQKRFEESLHLGNYGDWIERFHVQELEDLGYIAKHVELSDRIRCLLNLFRIANPSCIDAELEQLCVPCPKHETQHTSLESQYVWIAVGRRIVELGERHKVKYAKSRFEAMLVDLRERIHQNTSKDGLQRYFENAGVSLIFVQGLKEIAVDGAAFWHCNHPVIQMVCDYTDERFWYNLLHLSEHVLKGTKRHIYICFQDANSEEKKTDKGLKQKISFTCDKFPVLASAII